VVDYAHHHRRHIRRHITTLNDAQTRKRLRFYRRCFMEPIESRSRAAAEEDQWPGQVVMCLSMQQYQPCLCSGCWANVHRMSHIESLLVGRGG
jgi:hypothetical protein